jgi:hypothetical protein
MTQKSAILNANVIIGADVKDLFPATLGRKGTEQKFFFNTFQEFDEFLNTLIGYYAVYTRKNAVIVDKYVVGAGMYTIFQSE